MNIEQLQYIVEVDKHSSQSAAAQNLHVTQSTISQSITNLENELGIKTHEGLVQYLPMKAESF